MILITGAAGTVGLALIRAFGRRGLMTRAFIHSSKNEQKVISAGATEVYIGDMTDAADVDAALAGADALYFVCSAANPDEDKIGEMMIDCAKHAGGIYFVYHSVLHSIEPDLVHHQKKLKVEQALITSGLEYTIIQPAVFMQMFLPAVAQLAAGEDPAQKFYTSDKTLMSFIDVDDMATAAAEIVASRDYIDATVELCGTERLSLSDIEDAFSKIAGRRVSSRFIDDDAFLAQAHLPADSYAADTLLKMFAFYNQYGFKGNGAALERILKRKPTGFEEFVRANFPSNR